MMILSREGWGVGGRWWLWWWGCRGWRWRRGVWLGFGGGGTALEPHHELRLAKCVAFENWMMRNVEERTQAPGLLNLLIAHYELSSWFSLSPAVWRVKHFCICTKCICNRVGILGLVRNWIITMTSRVFAAVITKIVSSPVDNRTHLSVYFCNITKPVNAPREHTDRAWRELIIHPRVFLWRSSTSICNRCDKPSVSQGPQATFGVRCTQLAPKHGGPQTAQIESYPRFSPHLAPTLPITPFLLRASRPKQKEKGKGKESESLAGDGLSCLSSGAKQELASKRLKAVGLIWGQTECIKRWLLLSVMTTSCAPMFNYFSVMSLPTFHCSTRKTACNSRNTGGETEWKKEWDNAVQIILFMGLFQNCACIFSKIYLHV